MKNNLKILCGVIALIIFADIFGAMMWSVSGQHPTDNFYIGTITIHILNLKNSENFN